MNDVDYLLRTLPYMTNNDKDKQIKNLLKKIEELEEIIAQLKAERD